MRTLPIFTLTALLFYHHLLVAQCNLNELNSQCLPQISSGFNFIKSYNLDAVSGSKEKIEYSYIFCKGTQYLINICTPENDTNGIIVSLYDSKRNKVATSNVDNKPVSHLAYHCSASGIYYIQYTFIDKSTGCGGSALAFKRN